MEAFQNAGVELHTRQSSKRKRFEDGEGCAPAKRPLTEEAMAAIMHQLNLASASLPPLSSSPGPLNITAVTTCPATMGERHNDTVMRGATPSSRYCDSSSPPSSARHLLTPPHTSFSPTKPQMVPGSAVTEGLDSSVHIRVIPATPPSSESSGSPSREEYEPMEQTSSTSLSKQPDKSCRVVLEDISSDSSDSEVSQRVWIAPELKTLTGHGPPLLPSPILEEIAKKGMAVVPWVQREQFLTRALAKSQEQSDDTENSSSEGEGSSQDMQCWECGTIL